MKKVLRILNRFNIGGPTHNATYLTKFLEPEFSTKLIAGKKLNSEAGSEHLLSHHNIDYMILDDMSRSINVVKDIKTFFKIRKIIKDFNPEIVHTHASKSGALGRLAAISMDVPIIVHTFHGHVFHSYFGFIKTKLYIFIERFLAKKSSAIIAISSLQKKELSEDFSICHKEKISVIPLGFDLIKFQENTQDKRLNFRKEFNIADNEVAIGIVGRLTLIKNHKLFINSINVLINNLIKENIKVKAFIIGDGEEREALINLCYELNLSCSQHDQINKDAVVHFTSWRKDMDTVYAGLDIVSLTSLNEGTPVTLIEAQASNKPIVTTNVGGILDIVIKNKTALIADKDAYDFSAKLLQLCNDEFLRHEMGSSGYDHVKNLFGYERLVYDVKNLYRKLENSERI
jgi:glycosyltransferase involved in cell wall biosynthesis